MMSTKFKIICGVIFLVALIALWAIDRGYESIASVGSLEKYGNYLRKEFPGVEHISTGSLSTMLRAHEAGLEPLELIDCRSLEEFRVSHIPGAVNLATTQEIIEYLKERNVAENAHVVVYCSVGARSARLAIDLQKAGLNGVKNVVGSIFSWANEGRPLVDGAGHPTGKVHPYNRFWAKQLTDGRAADITLDE